MVHKVLLKLIAITAVVLISLATVQVAFASESTHVAAATPDVTVILGVTGSTVAGVQVQIDGTDAGKTDSKGNLTLKEPLTGNHTVTVSKKGINNTTITADFTHKPVVVKVGQEKSIYTTTIHVTDKNTKKGVAGVEVINNKYSLGTTDANGDLVIEGYPMGLYLLNLNKDGYKKANVGMVVYNNKVHNFALTPA